MTRASEDRRVRRRDCWYRRAALASACALLVACERPHPPTPPVARPVLERPVGPVQRGTSERLYVPREALVERGGVPGVFVLQSPAPFPPPVAGTEGEPLPRARFRMLRPGRTVEGRVEVLSGLAGGERVVLGDLADVLDGSPIVVFPAQEGGG